MTVRGEIEFLFHDRALVQRERVEGAADRIGLPSTVQLGVDHLIDQPRRGVVAAVRARYTLAATRLAEWLHSPTLDTPRIDALRRQAVKDGMRALRLAGAMKVAEGLTTIDEVLRTTPSLDMRA